jgi:hypothetical protein
LRQIFIQVDAAFWDAGWGVSAATSLKALQRRAL